MKTTILGLLTVLCWVVGVRGQSGMITFNNGVTKVTNALTGQPVVSGNTFKVTLYGAVDGTSNETALAAMITTNIGGIPGLFNGGIVPVPFVTPGDYGIFQVRIWETAYGNTYEEARQAPAMNGRTALLGKSNLVRVRVNAPPSPPLTLWQNGMQPIVVSAEPVPSFSINNIVVSEGTNGTKEAVFTVTLLPASTNSASIDFATVDGTALAGADYVATNGTVAFAAGQTSNTIAVTLTADFAAEPDEDFFVQLTNNAGGYISQPLGRCTITEVRVTGIQVAVAVTFNTVAGHHYMVEMSDDFVNWTSVEGAENVTGTGNLTTVVDRSGGYNTQQRIYRARLLE